jgi:transcriptional regulator with XRE-family HTH domain
MTKKAAPFKQLKALGDRLKKIRISAGLSQKEAGQNVGVSDATVSNWEKGIFEPPLSYLEYLAENFNCDLNWLLTGIEKSSQPPNEQSRTVAELEKENYQLLRENRQLRKDIDNVKKETAMTATRFLAAESAPGEASAKE